MARIEDLAERYGRHIATPWQRTVAGAQRVVMVVYRPIVGRPGEHEIDRDQAAVVLRIFRDYAEGSTCREIAAALNHEGVKPFRGRAWNASTDLQRDLSRRHHLEPRRQNTQSADGPQGAACQPAQ